MVSVFCTGINCSGKTTLSKELARIFGGIFVSCEVDEFIVNKFYTGKVRDVKEAEKVYQKTLNKIFKKAKGDLVFFDRHPFEQLLYSFDRFYKTEFFDDLFSFLVKNLHKQRPSLLIIFVASDVRVILRRVERFKSQSYKKFLTFERLYQLNKLYQLIAGVLKGVGFSNVVLFDSCEPLERIKTVLVEEVKKLLGGNNEV